MLSSDILFKCNLAELDPSQSREIQGGTGGGNYDPEDDGCVPDPIREFLEKIGL